MEYTTLGNTDIQISKLCVGCMSFGKAGTMHDWTLDETETEKVVKHALSLEINFFDTANGYSAGTSEEYLGRALKKERRPRQGGHCLQGLFQSRQAVRRGNSPGDRRDFEAAGNGLSRSVYHLSLIHI